MDELDKLLQDIDKLRSNLNKLIAEKKTNLQDSEIISASQILDATITKYIEIIEKKTKG